MKKHITISEIAKLTGFSHTTISRAFNYPEKVKLETREKILAVANEYNYRPNLFAKAISSGKTNTFYVYVPSAYAGKNPFYLNVIAGIVEEFGKTGRSVTVQRKFYDNEVCDGVIFMGLTEKQIKEVQTIAQYKNVVVFGKVPGVRSIDVDNKYGMQFITNKVLEKGRRNLIYLSIDENRDFVQERCDGFIEAINAYKDVEYKVLKTQNNFEDAYIFIKANANLFENVDAVICASDDIALAFMQFASEKAITVPGDVSLTGFDGFGREQEVFPKLTTMRQPVFEIGHMLANEIIEMSTTNEVEAKLTLIKPTFIRNNSL